MTNKTIITILFCVEKGLLEQQAILLIESIKRLSNSNQYRLIAFSPRRNYQPSKETVDYLKINQVLHLTNNINQDYLDYPIANKVLSSAYVEQHIHTEGSILFVDTDTIFINDIESKYIENDGQIYIRPVDNKGPGSEGVEDINDPFWQNIFKLFKLKPPSTKILTTVRRESIRNYYNAGFIWSHKVNGFFTQWLKDFETIIESGLRPFGYQSRENTNFRCLDQVALSVTTSRYRAKTKILSPAYNYPLPFKPLLDLNSQKIGLENMVHAHYHKWFQHPGFIEHIFKNYEKKSNTYAWLANRLPIRPEISDAFKY